jgi:alkylglycerol monooxygenase
MSQYTAVFTRVLRVGIYAASASTLSLVPAEAAAAFWTHPAGWVLALVFYDFCYYWHHRAGTRMRPVLGRARRAPPEPALQPVDRAAPDQQGVLVGWVFYLPMAVLGRAARRCSASSR